MSASLDSTLDPMEEIRFRKKHGFTWVEIQKDTHFTFDELEQIMVIFFKIQKRDDRCPGTDLITRNHFRDVLHNGLGMTDAYMMERVMVALDRGTSPHVTMATFAKAMSLYLRGDLEERIAYAFTCYDLLSEGHLRRETMYQLMKKSLAKSSRDDDVEEAVKELVDIMLKRMDPDLDGVINFQDFHTTVIRTPSLLESLGYCLPERPAVYAFISTWCPTWGDSDSEPVASFGKKLSNGMSGLMTKMRTSPPAATAVPALLENNPILQHFEIGSECSSTAGPGLIWRVHVAYRKTDGKEFSVFVFDKRIAEKLLKPKRKETMLDAIRLCVAALNKHKHPKFLQIVHPMEEGTTTIAFASEAIIGSLHNILNWHECNVPPGHPPPVQPHPITLGPPTALQPNLNGPTVPPPFAKEYSFMDIEYRYGLLQLIDSLSYMHYNLHLMHRNVCPQVIVVTKRGTWKMFGLEFAEPVHPKDPTTMVSAPPWSVKVAKLSQPELDFLAPEVQISGHCSILSDMFSLGLVICAVFNNGKPLIQANNNPMLYMKQIEYLDQQVLEVLPKVPGPLQEAVQRLLARDPHPRPTTQLLPLIKYFNIHALRSDAERAIVAMQFLDCLIKKDAQQKAHFFRETLLEALPIIPERLLWQHIWPALRDEVELNEALASVLQSVMWMVKKANEDEFILYIFPTIKLVFKSPRSIQATVTLLEHLHIIMKKGVPEEIETDVLPVLYYALDSNTFQIQAASLIATQNICEAPENKPLTTTILNKVKALLERNQSDVKIISLILCFFEKTVVRFDRSHILEQVIPTLLAMRLTDPDIVTRVVKLYKNMLLERKFGLNTNVMATKMIPSLAPQTVNPALNVDQFTNLMEILYDMLESIDRQQRYKLKADNLALPSPETRRQKLRHQMSTDNMNAPPFNIPNLRVERKTSSAEDMARKNSMTAQPPPPATSASGTVGGFKSKHDEFPTCSVKTTATQRVLKKLSSGTGIGQWFFGSSNSTNNDNNFLRVSNAFPNRRLSDNTLMTPKIKIAPSCASSPGGTPGSTSGLPTRRHSSIGPQERRGSTVNLSPPTQAHQYRGRGGGSGSSLSVPSTSQCVLARSMIGGSMPNTSSSVPFLLTSSMQSIRSRRPSAASSQGSGLLQQISSGMVRHLPSSARHHSHASTSNNWSIQGATAAGYNALHHTAMAVRKCPSLNITLTR